MYGIANCDTIKKARNWLKDNQIDFEFHDYRKQGLEQSWLEALVDELGWEALINKRGLTWRKLDDDVKTSMDQHSAIAVMLDNPAIIKRPLLISQANNNSFKQLGFKAETWEKLLKLAP